MEKNSEKAIILRSEGKDFILQGLVLDSMMYTTSSIKLIDELLRKYSKDYQILQAAW